MIYVDEDSKLLVNMSEVRAIGRASLEDDTVITIGFKNLDDNNLLTLVGDQSNKFWNWLVRNWQSGNIL